ncbi:MAG TPA: S24 family peptidase [Bacteroidia bacterium]|nr:S24 family peptidase [Bacteroidia bacterium]
MEEIEYLKSLRIIKRDSEIVKSTGYSKGLVSNYINGKIPISEAFKEKFYEVYGEHLPKNKVSDVETKSQGGNIIHVPLIAYGGFLQGYANKVFMDSLQRFSLPGVNGEHYAFEVDGMSMFDLAAPGDTAIARLEEKVDWMIKGKPYVLQTIDGLLIKLYDGIKGEKWIFKSYNPEYKPIEIPLRNLKRVYFVTRILKKV